MRKALVTFLAAVLLVCMQSGVPGGSNDAPPQQAVTYKTGNYEIERLLERTAEFPLASHFTLYGPVDPARALRRFDGGAAGSGDAPRPVLWQAYTTSVWSKYHTLKQPPVELMVVEALKAVPCDQRLLATKDLGQPFACPKLNPDKEPGRPSQGYVLVVPKAFYQNLLSVVAKLDNHTAWQVVSMAMALLHAQYLRQMHRTVIDWPAGSAMDYCVAGISNRAVFPRLTFPAQADRAMPELDKVFGVVADATHATRRTAFIRGYLTGSLASCTWRY